MGPSGPSYRARRASFLSSSVAPFTPFGLSLFKKEGQLGWRLKNYRLTVQCSWVDDWNDVVDGDKVNGMTVEKQRSSSIQTSDKFSGSIYGIWHVLFFDWFLSRIEALLRLPCTFPLKNTPFFSHFSNFRRNTLSEHVHHICQRSCPFNSCILRSHSFTLWLGK